MANNNPGGIAEPINVTIRDATSRTGISRSTLYRLAASGEIRMVKSGRTSLIPWGALRDYAMGLPDALLRKAA
jgi:excisionase family DNA binding protein